MKRLLNINKNTFLIFAFCLAISTSMYAQDEFIEEDSDAALEINSASYVKGRGLNFSLNGGDYSFGLTGFIQPGYFRESNDGFGDSNQFSSKRTFFQLDGRAIKEKVSFFVQLDFSLPNPLMDAWLAYHPTESITISFGQKQNFANNREMLYREDRLQFVNRSFLSQNFSNTGREFGVFISSKFGDKFGINPMLSVTSGDGRNSFGTDSRDTDFGGFKYGGRLDLYPLGYFKDGNDVTSTDLGREESVKIAFGIAGSINKGASNSVGEGHGDFLLYDENQANNFPDYTQIYTDLLLKYQGFSFLAEYVNASASNLDLVFTDANSTQILVPGQISEFLVLGDSFNLQTGYVTKSGYSLDLRYESLSPEFENNVNSILQNSSAFTVGFTKYFKGNNLKVQTAYSSFNPAAGNNISQFEVLFQIAF